MWNYLFIVVITLFYAIVLASVYKFFKHKKWGYAVGSFIFILISLLVTVLYFSMRNVLVEDEITYFINALRKGEGSAFFLLLCTVAVILWAFISYRKVMQLERKQRERKKTMDQ